MQQGINPIARFLPMIILGIICVIFNIFIAPRKGRSRILYGILAVIPFFGFFSVLYLVSLPEKIIENKLDKIIELLQISEK